MGKMPADVRQWASLPHFRLEKLSASDTGGIHRSVDAKLSPLSVNFALSHFCLGRRRRQRKGPLSGAARLRRLLARLPLSTAERGEGRGSRATHGGGLG